MDHLPTRRRILRLGHRMTGELLFLRLKWPLLRVFSIFAETQKKTLPSCDESAFFFKN